MLKFLTTFASFYLILCASLYLFQRTIQYQPSGKIHSPKTYDLENFKELKLSPEKNIKLLVWYKEPHPQQKIIIYFHGNAGNLGDRSEKLNILAKNFGILALSYRGYSGSTGKPSEENFLKDAKALTKFLNSKGYKAQDIILYGESLGSGVAIREALRINPFGLILESPYTSIASVAKRTYFYVPVNLLLKDKFESIKYTPHLKTPTLIFHGTKDRVVPYQEGKTLFESLNSKKQLITVEGGTHVNFNHDLILTKSLNFFFN